MIRVKRGPARQQEGVGAPAARAVTVTVPRGSKGVRTLAGGALGAGVLLLLAASALPSYPFLQPLGAALITAGGTAAWWAMPAQPPVPAWVPKTLAAAFLLAMAALIAGAAGGAPTGDPPPPGPSWTGPAGVQVLRGVLMALAGAVCCVTLPRAIRGRPADEWIPDMFLVGLGVTVPLLMAFVPARLQAAPLAWTEAVLLGGLIALSFAGASIVLWPRPPFDDPGQVLVLAGATFALVCLQLAALGGGWGPFRYPYCLNSGMYLVGGLFGAGALVRTARPRFESLGLTLSVAFGVLAASSPWVSPYTDHWLAFPIAAGAATLLAFRLTRTSARLQQVAAREQEAARRLRAADEMKTTFLRAVSHDLRTPLTVIIGSSLTLERSDHLLTPEERLELVRRLGANARKLNKLLADLLDLDRLSRGILEPTLRPTNVGALVRKLVSGMDALADRPVTVDAPSVVAWVDPPKLERIIENLLINVARHTPASTPVWVSVRSEGGAVLITVDDAGPGLPPDRREAIFEAFQQGPTAAAHAPGVGIGLSLVARFAELQGGRAWVEDRPGGGCSFRVRLPAGPPDATGSAGGNGAGGS